MMAVEVEVSTLPDALELDEALSINICVDLKMLAIPDDGVGEVDNVAGEGFVFVEGMGKRHALP